MAETVTNRRRIDRLKALAIEQGFTNEDAKQFGKLSKTATWEALLQTYGIPLHPVKTVDRGVDNKVQSLDTSDWTNDASFPVCNFIPQNSTNFLEWVDGET
jgi:crotonobetainyl-CoA:carnitine CoA-transferase CaiB-like acyl-CoA transferase